MILLTEIQTRGLFLTGGPPQHDTWDPKPDAPAEIRGELKPIATVVPGLHVSEIFPRLAQLADKYCVVRSVTHHDTVHTSAGYTMLTGVPHLRANSGSAANIHPTPNDHPHLGSLLAKVRQGDGAVPVFASLPEVIKDAAVNEFPGQGAGVTSVSDDGRYVFVSTSSGVRMLSTEGRLAPQPQPDAFINSGYFEVTGSYPLRELDLETGTISERTDNPGGDVHYSTRISRSADRSVLLFEEDNKLFTFNAASGAFSTTNANAGQQSAVSRNGALIALGGWSGGAIVLDAEFRSLKLLSGVGAGVGFDPVRDMPGGERRCNRIARRVGGRRVLGDWRWRPPRPPI
ncbi:MAG: DUF1501 domain-containing protein [Planctomycetes bacterium]|nr:DUF1501 domain-containing protein [Planctomycetota bacterium]